MITNIQCKMARAAVGLGIRDLAAKSGVGIATVTRFENGQVNPNTSTVEALQRALEDAGVEFIPENGGGAGVRLKKSQPDAIG